MKTIIAAFAISVISSTAFANTVDSAFERESPIPVELRSRILQAIQSQCTDHISAYGLKETRTDVRMEKIDQGVVDYFYTTTFTSRYFFDGMHPVTTYITVESAQFSFSNGDNLEVSSVICP